MVPGLLLWLLYFFATMVVVMFIVKGGLMHFADKAPAQGLAAITEV